VPLGTTARWLVPLLVGGACAGGPNRDPEPYAPTTTNAPELLAPPVGAFIGRVLDGNGRPLQGARVQRIDGDRVVDEVRCGGDGTFVLGGVPPGRCSLRALADGFAPGQLGDLDATNDDGRAIDVGALVLLPATPYRGIVRSGGRALAGARVRVHTDLQTAGTTVPLVREAITDADGWFFVPDAPPPPVLVQPLAAWHAREPARRVERADANLEFDLPAMPTIVGQVVDADDGTPLGDAYVQRIELAPDQPLRTTSLPDFARLPHDRVDRDGRFVRERRSERWAVAVVAAGHVGTVFGPFDTTTTAMPPTLALPRGAELQCQLAGLAPTATVLVALYADASASTPTLVRYSGPAANAALPPVPPGRWHLRIDSEVAAPQEQWLELAAAGRHLVDVRLAAGTSLQATVRGADGRPLQVMATRGHGLPRTAEVLADGTATVRHLGPGPWQLYVLDPRPEWSAQCQRWLAMDLGPTSIDLPSGAATAAVELVAPALAFGSVQLRTNDPTIDRLVLEPPPDAPAAQTKVRDVLRRTDLRDGAGTFRLDPVLPGRWLLRAFAGARLVHERAIEVETGAPTVVTLP